VIGARAVIQPAHESATIATVEGLHATRRELMAGFALAWELQ